MQKIGRYIVILLTVWLLPACQSSSQERKLAERQVLAEKQTAELCEALNKSASMDTIRLIAERNEDVLFYVFDARQMVY